MSDYLLDTDVLIRCLRGVPDSLELAQALTEQGDLHISVWSHLEILTLTQPREEKRTLEFLAPLISHPVTDVIAQRAAALLRDEAAAGSPLTFSEAIIAATAMLHSLALVTYGARNLNHIMELKIYPLPQLQKR